MPQVLVYIICKVCGKEFDGGHEVLKRWADHQYQCMERKKNWMRLRDNIISRDKACVKCRSKLNLHVHHLIPRGKGGTDDPSNLTAMCRRCHSLAHGRPIRGLTWNNAEIELWKEELELEGEFDLKIPKPEPKEVQE